MPWAVLDNLCPASSLQQQENLFKHQQEQWLNTEREKEGCSEILLVPPARDKLAMDQLML